MIRTILAALQLWVAPILAGFFTLWSGLVAFAEHDDAGVSRLLSPSEPVGRGQLAPARSLHVVHLGLLAMAATLAATAVSWWAWPVHVALVRFSIAVSLVWILGELLPRVFATIEPGLVPFNGRFVQHTLALLKPFLTLVAWMDRGFRRGVSGPSPTGPSERERMTGILGLARMSVAEVMTPRLDVMSVDFSVSRDEVIETFRRAEHSRLLVIDGDPDSITGVIYAKDLLPGLGPEVGPADWHPLIRSVGFVPEAKTLDRQLRDFQRSASHLVVVVDEFGGTSGILTLEDVLEQIVGEIRDEYDTDEVAPVQRLPEGGWAVQGDAPLAALEAEVGHNFAREDVSTVGGLVLALFGRVPRAGEILELDGFRLTVDQVVRRRVRRVTLAQVLRQEAASSAESNG